jgi:hypothetical protein
MLRIDLDIRSPENQRGPGMTTEPEGLVLQLLRALRGDLAKRDAKLDETRSELKAEFKTRFRGETNSLRADLASDMLVFHEQTSEQRPSPGHPRLSFGGRQAGFLSGNPHAVDACATQDCA